MQEREQGISSFVIFVANVVINKLVLNMKWKRRYFRIAVLALLLLFVWLVRFSSGLGEWYALHIYPLISSVLSMFSSLFPFSLGDVFIFLSITGVIVYPLFAWYNRRPWKITLLRVGEYLLWVYVWFYLAWGLNYFRHDFYTRASVSPVEYTTESFSAFLDTYVRELNDTYVPVKRLDDYVVEEEVKKGYGKIRERFGMTEPRGWQRVKTMLFTPFISKVGISGYMGPFFSEFNLNGDLLPSQYPSTYAHEMAHLLGITSEAEANLYAYLVCVGSDNPQIRFSGNMLLLPHVLNNAFRLLPKEEYTALVHAIRPEVIRLYEDNRAYWQEKYSPFIGDIQDTVYDWFLKGNRIQSGRKNYSEVIGLLLSLNALHPEDDSEATSFTFF